MKVTDKSMRTLKIAKLFRDSSEQINNFDFSPNGETVVSSSKEGQISIYSCSKGTRLGTLQSKKYGVDHIHFTRGKDMVVHGSTKVDDTIRYLDLRTNGYIRYFSGHTKKVASLCMSSVDDTFLSSSLDKTVRIWDTRSPNCQGLLNTESRPVAAYSCDGLVFAVADSSKSVQLYDLRSFDRASFKIFDLPKMNNSDVTGIKFSPDGSMILVSTNGGIVKLVDSWHGKPLETFSNYNRTGLVMEASFSLDSQYVLAGSTDGMLRIWKVDSGFELCKIRGDCSLPVQCVKFNPRYMMIASTCKNMAFWIPSLKEDESDEGGHLVLKLEVKRDLKFWFFTEKCSVSDDLS